MLDTEQVRVLISEDGTVSVNGQRCDDLSDLRGAMDISQTFAPTPEIILQAEPASRYEDFIMVFTVLKQANVQQLQIASDDEAMREGERVATASKALFRRASQQLTVPSHSRIGLVGSCSRAVAQRPSASEIVRRPHQFG